MSLLVQPPLVANVPSLDSPGSMQTSFVSPLSYFILLSICPENLNKQELSTYTDHNLLFQMSLTGSHPPPGQQSVQEVHQAQQSHQQLQPKLQLHLQQQLLGESKLVC